MWIRTLIKGFILINSVLWNLVCVYVFFGTLYVFMCSLEPCMCLCVLWNFVYVYVFFWNLVCVYVFFGTLYVFMCSFEPCMCLDLVLEL